MTRPAERKILLSMRKRAYNRLRLNYTAVATIPEGPERIERTFSAWRLPITYDAIGSIVLFADALTIALSSILSGGLYHFARFGLAGDLADFLGVAAVVAGIFIPIMKLRKVYHPIDLLSLRRQISVLLVAWTFSFAFLFGVAFALKISDVISRGYVIVFLVLGLTMLLVSRVLWRAAISSAISAGRLTGRKIALITQGESDKASLLVDLLARHGFHVIKNLLLSNGAFSSEEGSRTLLLKTLTSLRGSDVEEIFVSADWRESQELVRILEQTRIVPLPVRYIPDPATSSLIMRTWQEIGKSIVVDVQRAPLSRAERALKRSFDVTIAAMGVLFLSPLMLMAAIAIRLETPGPVFFRQARRGFNGREFTILKFRTMIVLENGPLVQQATRDDKRVTRCGYWLRRTSIDELPQLFNVLTGQMSIVGPRPHAVAHDDHYDRLLAHYALRQHMKPGLTGWAQVNGYRGETPTLESMARRVEFDLWYVDNWSLWRDILVLFRTVVEVVRSPNAY